MNENIMGMGTNERKYYKSGDGNIILVGKVFLVS